MHEEGVEPRVEIAYVDESYDSDKFAMAALIVPIVRWNDCFAAVKAWRRDLRQRCGVYTNKELHAWKFVSGRGNIGARVVPKGLRASIFFEAMDLITQLPGVQIISGCWDRADVAHPHAHAFSRLQERLQTRCRKSGGYILTIVDQGRAEELRKVARKSKIYNPVGSALGMWPDGSPAKNIPNDRLVEDPLFRSSAKSYFLQLADFVAFALLKSEVPATPHVRRYRLNEAFLRLEPALVKVAHRADPRRLGILRK